MPATNLRTPFRFLEEGEYNEPHYEGRPLTIVNSDDDDVAEIYSADDATVSIPREAAIATARLFAAAPAMLATLKEIQTRYSPFGAPGALIDETIRQAEGRR